MMLWTCPDTSPALTIGSTLANANDDRRVRMKWSAAAKAVVAEPSAATERKAAFEEERNFIVSQLDDDGFRGKWWRWALR